METNVISIEEYREQVERGEATVIVDVRTPAEFQRVHARGARSVPLEAVGAEAMAAVRGSAAETICLICHSGSRARAAMTKLIGAGVDNVCCIEGGTVAWEQAGLPVVHGASGVISIDRQVRIGAGFLVLLGLALAWWVHPAFLAVSALVGAGLIIAGITDFCGMSILLAKMPWNRAPGTAGAATPCSGAGGACAIPAGGSAGANASADASKAASGAR